MRKLLAVIIISIFGSFILSVFLNGNPQQGFLDSWNKWDGPHYIEIAKSGYVNSGENRVFIAFFPFYPVLISAFTIILRDFLLSALVISNIAYAVAAFYLYKIVLLDHSKKIAMTAVILFSIFPTAYFLHAGYTESLFIALTVSSFYYARKGMWAVSGILGALSSATRIVGVILLPAILLEYLHQKKFRLGKIRKDILLIFIIPVGFLSYLLINQAVFGDMFTFQSIQKNWWGQELVFPMSGIFNSWNSIFWRGGTDSITVGSAQIGFALLGLAFSIYSIKKQRPSYSFFMTASWLIAVSTSFWMSVPRLMLIAFPMFISASVLCRKGIVRYPVFVLSFLLFAFFLSLFVTGSWAF